MPSTMSYNIKKKFINNKKSYTKEIVYYLFLIRNLILQYLLTKMYNNIYIYNYYLLTVI